MSQFLLSKFHLFSSFKWPKVPMFCKSTQKKDKKNFKLKWGVKRNSSEFESMKKVFRCKNNWKQKTTWEELSDAGRQNWVWSGGWFLIWKFSFSKKNWKPLNSLFHFSPHLKRFTSQFHVKVFFFPPFPKKGFNF